MERGNHHDPAIDQEPPVGTVLEIGSPGDHLTFQRLDAGGWQFWHNGDRPRPCSYDLIKWWGTCRVVAWPASGKREAA